MIGNLSRGGSRGRGMINVPQLDFVHLLLQSSTKIEHVSHEELKDASQCFSWILRETVQNHPCAEVVSQAPCLFLGSVVNPVFLDRPHWFCVFGFTFSRLAEAFPIAHRPTRDM